MVYTCIVRDCRSFVNSCNFTDKTNSYTFEVEIRTFWPVCCESEAILSKKSRFGHPSWSVYKGKFSSQLPRSRLQKPRSR